MTDLGDFRRLVYDPLVESARRTSSCLNRAQTAYVRAAKHTRQPIDLNFVAVPKDDWEDLGRALADITSTSSASGADRKGSSSVGVEHGNK